MSLICSLFGHNYVPASVDSEGMCEVVCTRCPAKAKMPRSVLCNKGQHEWKPAGVDHYEVRAMDNRVLRNSTMRTWKCKYCDAIKQDERHEKLDGVWFIVDGEFIHEDEIKRLHKNKYRIVEKETP